MTQCSADGCTEQAITWLRFAGMGDRLHVHVCSRDEATDREWCDVVESGPLPCPEHLACNTRAVLSATPPLLAASAHEGRTHRDEP